MNQFAFKRSKIVKENCTLRSACLYPGLLKTWDLGLVEFRRFCLCECLTAERQRR